MIDVETNPIKKIRISKNYRRKSLNYRKTNIISFRADNFVMSYLSRVIQKTSFINKAIYFYINYLNNPEKIMKDLKLKYPEMYKKVGRRKF